MWIDGLAPFGTPNFLSACIHVGVRHYPAGGLNAATPEGQAQSILRVATAELYDRRCVLGKLEISVVKPLSPIKGREPVFFALFAGGNHVEPLALQDEGKDGAATSRKLDLGGHCRTFWSSSARPSGLVARMGGAGAGHGIDVERLFDYVGGVGGVVLREPVFDADHAVFGRG